MPFNFQDTYVNPNVQIKGEEIPLEQLEKTSNIIQGRYDQSMDNETKIGAVTKKLLASSNPVDHETARQIMEHNKTRLAERAKSGNYQDMVWQTQQDAMDVAGMYEGLTNRNKQISEYEKFINLNDKTKSPEIKAWQLDQFKKGIGSSQFDASNGVLQGLNVDAPNIVNDFDYGEWAMKNAGQWKPDTFGGKNVKTISTTPGQKLPDGTISAGGLYKVTGNHVTEKVTKKEIMQGLSKMAQEHPELQATLNRDMQVYGPEVTMAKLNQTLDAAADAHSYTRQLANEESITFDEQSTNNASGGKGKPIQPEGFTQLPSAIFKNPISKNPLKIDSSGNIVSTQNNDNIVRSKSAIESVDSDKFIGKNNIIKSNDLSNENSVTYKRVVDHLKKLGKIPEGADRKVRNLAIADFWNNELAEAESSILVAKPGDKKANDYFAEINRAYFGDLAPNASAKGTSVLTGQLAQATFTDEKGEKINSKQLFNDVKDRNVRVTGLVSQYQSPFEYGSHYMTATNPETGETKNYLIEPDLNTKNTGAYFANRIVNSTKQKDLVSKWNDGYGIQYEATPINGGKEYIIYLNKDVNTPVKLNNEEVQMLSQYPEGQASKILNDIYLSKKQ
jgi:hypothetical protein